MPLLLLSDLPTDVLLRVTDHLSVGDLHALRLSGLCADDARQQAHLHSTMRRRVAALQKTMQHVSGPAFGRRHMSFHRAGSLVFFPCWNAVCALYRSITVYQPSGTVAQAAVHAAKHRVPCSNCHLLPAAVTRYTAAVGRLHASFPHDNADLRQVAREFPRVRSLQVSAFVPGQSAPTGTDTHAYLHGLHAFTRLHTLELHGCALTALPDSLLRLSGLRNLVLMRMPTLHALPRDMGLRLRQLSYLQLYFTGVSLVPRSVFDTLERNFPTAVRGTSVSVVDREGSIRDGPLFAELDAKYHPNLNAMLEMDIALVAD